MSRAIPIVAPTTTSSPGPGTNGRSTPVKKGSEPSTQRQCRNILIYGSCKNEGKSCVYYHPPRNEMGGESSSLEQSSPILQPVPSSAIPLSVNINAAPFVPRGVLLPSLASRTSPPSESEETLNTPITGSSANGETAFEDHVPASMDMAVDHQMADVFSDMSVAEYVSQQQQLNHQLYPNHGAGPNHDPYAGVAGQSNLESHVQPMMIHADAYYGAPTYMRQPLDHHLYTSLPHVASIPDSQRIFLSDSLREDLQKRSEATYATPSPSEVGLPERLHQYHSLVTLDKSSSGGQDKRKSFGGWGTTVYKAVSKDDGNPFCLRRVEGFRLVQQVAFGAIEGWTKFKHPNVVSVIEAFTTKSFGDSSLVVAYDYHANAQTLHSFHFSSQKSSGGGGSPVSHRGKGRDHHQANTHAHIQERVIWTYVVQIANAIKAVHEAGMAVRTIEASKILLTGTNRVRLNGCGVLDVVAYNPQMGMDVLQQEDLVAFGKLVFSLCCNNPSAMSNLPKAMDTITRHYSPDLKNVALFLVSKPGPAKVIDVLLDMFGTRLLTEMNAMQTYSDDLENQLMGELENARLVRLLCKFGFINERPEFNHEPRWSETGDRYIIKLFRDYVFHQVDEAGNPVVNMSHVLTCLNKLDVGVDERIMLVSRDEQSCLVVSYKEVKSCIDQAYGELVRGVR